MNRKPLDYSSFSTLKKQMIENNLAASNAIEDLIKNKGQSMTLTLLMILDDMNIRGVQLGNLYKICNQDSEKLYEKILTIQKKDIDELNRLSITLTPFKAVYEGSKESREENPEKYLFTKDELNVLRKAKERNIVNDLLHNKPQKTPKFVSELEEPLKPETLYEKEELKPVKAMSKTVKKQVPDEAKAEDDLYPNIMTHQALDIIKRHGFICGYETTYINENSETEVYRVFYNDKKDIIYVHSIEEEDIFLWGESKLNVVRENSENNPDTYANAYLNVKGLIGYNIELRDYPFTKYQKISESNAKPLKELTYDCYDNNLIPIIESIGAMKYKRHNHDYTSCVIANICNLLVFPETYKKFDDGLKEIYKPLLDYCEDKAYDEIIYQLNNEEGIEMAIKLQDILGIKLNKDKLLEAKTRYEEGLPNPKKKVKLFGFLNHSNSELENRVVKVLDHKVSPVYITE